MQCQHGQKYISPFLHNSRYAFSFADHSMMGHDNHQMLLATTESTGHDHSGHGDHDHSGHGDHAGQGEHAGHMMMSMVVRSQPNSYNIVIIQQKL